MSRNFTVTTKTRYRRPYHLESSPRLEHCCQAKYSFISRHTWFLLTNLDRFPAAVGGVASGVILQWEVGHTVIFLVTVHQLGSIIVEGIRTVPVIVAVAGEALNS